MSLYNGSQKIRDYDTTGVYIGTGKTNCITHIPEDIKLELNSNVLILKAGSRVYIPNGFDFNTSIYGLPTINNGVVSGFSTSNYLALPNTFSPASNTWEMGFKFTTGSDVTNAFVIASGLTGMYFNWCVQNGKTQNNIGTGSGWLVTGDNTYGSATILPNTTYWIKATYDGSVVKVFLSTDGVDYQLDWSFTTTQKIASCTVVLGQGRTLSTTNVPQSIDVSQSYIKIADELFWQGTAGSGERIFDEVVIDSDVVVSCGNSGTRMAFLGRDGLGYDSNITFVSSGSTAPTNTGHRWYDTANNIIKEYINDSWQMSTSFGSLPFAILTADSNKVFTSIDQVFNGFGYIGNTMFALPNVKGLIPNGWDGNHYDNIELKLDKVVIDREPDITRPVKYFLYKNEIVSWGSNTSNVMYYDTRPSVAPTTYCTAYIKNENKWIRSLGSTAWVEELKCFEIGDGVHDSSGHISSITFNTVKTTNDTVSIGSVYKGSELVYKYKPYTANQNLFESSKAGTYSFTPAVAGTYQVILVGGGSGGAGGMNGDWSIGCAGSSGGYTNKQVTLLKKTYTINVGAGGAKRNTNDGYGYAGGDSKIVLDGTIIKQATGGKACYVKCYQGSTSTATVGAAGTGETKNGNKGSYSNQGDCSCTGGASVYNGYGKGGNGNRSGGYAGTAGYVKIVYVG